MHISLKLSLAIIALFVPSKGFTQGLAAPTLNKSSLVDIMPATSDQQGLYENSDISHPAIRLTPDKSEIINIDREAASIIIGNPNHLGILADSAQRLVLVPRAPGASFFTVLDKKGDIIMQRHAIIASPKKNYVRIRRTCGGSSDNCQETSVYYCPDMCHEIMIDNNEEGNTQQNAQALAQSSSRASNSEDTMPPPSPESFNENADEQR
ncbi:MAG: pilus assembly protein N-terminal domain-containing protein [Micavibrio sp.]|nr:pilus assembly protein N-terminal domain-containing protein [Micavibrio sp.]